MRPAKTWRSTWRRRNVSEPVLIKSTTAVTRYYRWHTFGIMSWWHIIFQNHDTTVYCTPENSNTLNRSLLWSNQVTKLCFHCSQQKEKSRPTVCDVWSLMMANNSEIKSPSPPREPSGQLCMLNTRCLTIYIFFVFNSHFLTIYALSCWIHDISHN